MIINPEFLCPANPTCLPPHLHALFCLPIGKDYLHKLLLFGPQLKSLPDYFYSGHSQPHVETLSVINIPPPPLLTLSSLKRGEENTLLQPNLVKQAFD